MITLNFTEEELKVLRLMLQDSYDEGLFNLRREFDVNSQKYKSIEEQDKIVARIEEEFEKCTK